MKPLKDSASDGVVSPRVLLAPSYKAFVSTTESFEEEKSANNEEINVKPSLELRVIVLSRFADIIATDVAGYQSECEIEENSIRVTIDTINTTAEKWGIPRRARTAFRSVALEALFFVGEYSLITRGSEALLDLSPTEFHGLFSSLLAAMGD